MESWSTRRSCHRGNQEKFITRVLLPAVEARCCPICLKILHERGAAVITGCKHAYCLECIRKWSNLKRKCPLCNAHFDSWFYKINRSSLMFLRKQLTPLNKGKAVIAEPELRVRDPRRIIQRSREESDSVRWRSRPFPWRRSFGRPGSVPPHVINERKVQWRASIYTRGLQAVPLSPKNSLEQNTSRSVSAKEGILQRIEPWIQRELLAILGDRDPSIIVHVASSLFIASLEGKLNVPSGQTDVQDDLFLPLRQFLRDQTTMFLHELRCFAESSLTMEAYDAVAEYRQLR